MKKNRWLAGMIGAMLMVSVLYGCGAGDTAEQKNNMEDSSQSSAEDSAENSAQNDRGNEEGGSGEVVTLKFMGWQPELQIIKEKMLPII